MQTNNNKGDRIMKTKKISSTNSTLAAANAASEMIPNTNWTYGDAANMANELNREARLFPTRHHPVPFPCLSSMTRSARFKAAFLKRTGWSWEDAVEQSRESIRDQRSHGERLYGDA
jgi:hypothetical protein